MRAMKLLMPRRVDGVVIDQHPLTGHVDDREP